jgi:signal transduction histidine kinase
VLFAELRGLPIETSIKAIGRIEAVPSILEVCCRVTGMGFAAVARVTETEWIACAVHDEIAFGLGVGGQLQVNTTLCDTVRTQGETIVFDHAALDPRYADHQTPRIYGLQSYISTPIVRADGSFFGTLCAVDPNPREVSRPETIETFKLFAQLIAAQLDADERIAASETAMLDQAAAFELQEQFIAVLGHDLRNPLAGADAGALMLSRMDLPDKAQRIVQGMRASHDRMGRLIDDVLDFARGRLGGGVPVQPRDHVDLGAVLEQVVDEVRAAHPDRAIVSDLDLEAGVQADPDRLAQLLSNLLGNALTHGAPEGEIRVTGAIRDGVFDLAVANPGVPIPKAAMARLFEPFRRGRATKDKRDGLGLGLYIAAQIAHGHGGVLDVTSEAGETVFRFRMPVAGAVA